MKEIHKQSSSDFDLGRLVMEQIEEAVRKCGRVNILIAGRTGVGKSTLINAVFQDEFATTGQGRPVTMHTREIKKEGVPLSIFDTRGLEMADYRQTLDALESFLLQQNGNADPQEHVHVGWVCIAEDSRRVEEAESQLVKMLTKYFPVVGVITKARADSGFKAEVQRLLPEASNVLRVRAIPEQDDDGHSRPPMGLVDLIKLTNELVPEGQRNALAAAQKVDMQSKINRAHGVVVSAAVAAAGVGAVPIPFSDAVLLIPIQIGELASITAVFGLPLSKGFLTTLVTSAAGCTAATFAGRTLVSSLFKFFPGVGSVAGGAIAAATAAALTTALGEAYIAVLAKLCQQKPIEEITEAEIADTFKRQLMAK